MKVVVIHASKESIWDRKLLTILSNHFHKNGDDFSVIKFCRNPDILDAPPAITPELLALDAQLIIFLNYQGAALANEYLRSGKQLLHITPGYIHPSNYQFSLNFNAFKLIKSDHKRANSLLERAHLKMKPTCASWQLRSSILYIGTSYDYAQWEHLGNPVTFDFKQCKMLTKSVPSSDVTIYYQPHHKLPKNTRFPKGVQICKSWHAVKDEIRMAISHAQPQLLELMLAGIPVMDSAPIDLRLIPLAGKELVKLNTVEALSSDEKWQTIIDLTSNEFTSEEVAEGLPLKAIAQHTAKKFEGTSDNKTLISQYQIMHSNPRIFRGLLNELEVREITKLVKAYNAKTLLDYGSGKGRQYTERYTHKEWGGIMPTCYDPGYGPFSKKPDGIFDGVICTDVAEHIPTNEVPGFLEDVLKYADKFAVLKIATRAARKFLPDGRNAHLTIQAPEWWNVRVANALKKVSKREISMTVVSPIQTNIYADKKSVVVIYES